MEAKGPAAPARVYQEFEPSTELVTEEECDTLLLYLPGFSKEQLRVQLRARNLIISGERRLEQNTWNRFRKEFPVSANCDLNKISAKFEGSILFVRQPKLITPAPKQEEEKPPVETQAPAPQKQADEPKVPQRTAQVQPEEKPTSETRPNGGKNEAVNAEDVPEKKIEKKSGNGEGEASEFKDPRGVRENASEKGKGVCENVPEKKASDLGDKHKRVQEGELDKTTRTALDNYKQAFGEFVTKLKTSRNAMNTGLVLLVGIVIGVYVSDSIKSWRKA